MSDEHTPTKAERLAAARAVIEERERAQAIAEAEDDKFADMEGDEVISQETVEAVPMVEPQIYKPPVSADPLDEFEAEEDERDGKEDPDDITLSDAEMEEIRAEARKKVAAEMVEANRAKKKALMARTLDAEILAHRREAGLTDYQDDLIDVLIDVAPFASDIRLDQTVYENGTWYTVDRRKYDTLREQMARSWDAEDRAGNPNRKFYRTVAGTMNPLHNERRMADGTLTMGLATAINARTGTIAGAPNTARLS